MLPFQELVSFQLSPRFYGWFLVRRPSCSGAYEGLGRPRQFRQCQLCIHTHYGRDPQQEVEFAGLDVLSKMRSLTHGLIGVAGGNGKMIRNQVLNALQGVGDLCCALYQSQKASREFLHFA